MMRSARHSISTLPTRFRRERLLIVGCGDIGLRVAQLLGPRNASPRLLALTSSPERLEPLRQHQITPLIGNLDHPPSVRRLAGIATHILYLAPPPNHPATLNTDPRFNALKRALLLGKTPKVLVYASTTGVYGDCDGAIVAETRPTSASTLRALRRLDAERQVRQLGRRRLRASILRIPGIYAPNRPQGTPRERLLRGTPALLPQDDVFTSHIHADDLARACVATLWRGKPQRIVNISDDSCLKMGDYFDFAASLYGLPKPTRISRQHAQAEISPLLLSFMSESRRICNQRMKQELRLVLKYPTVAQGLAEDTPVLS